MIVRELLSKPFYSEKEIYIATSPIYNTFQTAQFPELAQRRVKQGAVTGFHEVKKEKK